MTNQFVEQLNKYVFAQNMERTFVDKVLDRQDVESIKALMRKEDLTREELLELLYLLASNEVKLVNLGDWDRYLLGKYFAWIRDFVSIAETLYDYLELIRKNPDDEDLQLDDETRKELENAKKQILHAVKFNADVYLFLMRSTLSIEGVAFDTLTKNRFEYAYPQVDISAQPEQKSFMSFFIKR